MSNDLRRYLSMLVAGLLIFGIVCSPLMGWSKDEWVYMTIIYTLITASLSDPIAIFLSFLARKWQNK